MLHLTVKICSVIGQSSVFLQDSLDVSSLGTSRQLSTQSGFTEDSLGEMVTDLATDSSGDDR